MLGLWLGVLSLAGAAALALWPDERWIGVALLGLAALLAAGLAYLQLLKRSGLRWKDGQKKRMVSLACMVLFALAFAASAAVYFWPVHQPEIALQKFALFWIRSQGKDQWQLGVVLRLFNEEGKSFRIKGVRFATAQFTIAPRSSTGMKQLFIPPDHFDVVVNDDVPANSVKYVAKRIPFYLNATFSGMTPVFIVRGKWEIALDKGNVEVTPGYYTVYEKPITAEEWNDLLKPASKIDIENLNYMPMSEVQE